MPPRGIHVIHDERAARADVIRVRGQHAVIDGELAVGTEQVAEAAFALGLLEHVDFFDTDPGQLPPLGTERVDLMGQGALLLEQRFAGAQPFFAGCDLRMIHVLFLRRSYRDCGGACRENTAI